jgi:formylglycine-generating enzyme required for sulfatase activity
MSYSKLSILVSHLAVAVSLLPACSGDVSGEEPGPQDGGAGGEGAAPVCRSEPSEMVQLPQGYSIDATEVTRCQYQAWLDTDPSTADQEPKCAWNTDFTPPYPDTCGIPPVEDGDLPAGCVDWCDAYAYCKGVGKRLCGRIGGGALAMDDSSDPTKSQWYNACSSGGKYDYPYGDEYDQGTKCNDADRDKDHYTVAGSLPGCQSPDPAFAGVFDLSGNLWEWEDSCDGNEGPADDCMSRGGSNLSGEGYCTCSHRGGWDRNQLALNLGFRCCSP